MGVSPESPVSPSRTGDQQSSILLNTGLDWRSNPWCARFPNNFEDAFEKMNEQQPQPSFVKRKIREQKTRKKGASLARARAYRPTWLESDVKKSKVLKSLFDALGSADIEAVVRVWREAMNATKRMWDINAKKLVEFPDHRTRLLAANMVAAYMEGLPVERSIQAHSDIKDFDALLSQLRESPAALRDPLIRAKLLEADTVGSGLSEVKDGASLAENRQTNDQR